MTLPPGVDGARKAYPRPYALAVAQADPLTPPDDELELLAGFLDWQRAVIERKVEDLSLDAATEVVTPTGLSPLGIVKHLGHVEAQWFRGVFAGEDVERIRTDDDNSVEFVIDSDETVESVLGFYRDETDRARRIVGSASPEDMSVQPSRLFGHVPMRWILVHMIEETARHAGHLDMMREQLDGRTGD